MSASDPLIALQEAIKAKKPITYASDGSPTPSLASASHIVLSTSLALPKSTPTRLRRPGATSTDPTASPQDFFSLEAVYLAWLLREASSAEYMKQARENGLPVGFVSVTERKGLVDWLEGRTASHERVVPLQGESTTPPGTPPKHGFFASLPSTSALASSQPQASPAKRRYVADAQDVEIVKKIRANEIELRDRTTVLRGIKPNNFSALKLLYSEKLKKLKDPKGGSASAATPDPKHLARKAKNMNPIIIISSSPTALVTMYNVKRFLENAVFETSLDARARATAEGNPKPEDLMPIYRRRTNIDSSGRETESQVKYYVVDGVEALAKFGPDAWDRVVCVMTTGQAWQFRKYKWPEPKTLFHHVKGVYFTWTNDPANPSVKDWNVTELKIDRNRRHVDKAVVAHFWKILDAWTQANKPWLMK
ncbi:RNA polymerase II-associated protein [Punctularia strigosozonata HHB-11173 SS5]|uniref:RNA polymerase II-associated protein n=1 Tax=Punctularia strigosozonata (strain HHB-11173) TaxID=741275 RepID=UPI0004417238|nr:RNA polymerase II-associated protein [Punctularia strigosozonata HHB-11173 SS5]EIN07888.1 RNA polymerase II-associated protein [Punctularia strigosozonata HHB-11173 SS5]